MTEKELNNVSGEQVEDMTPDYLAAIKELKENSVDRAKYDQLRAENKKLLDAVINGQTVEIEQGKKAKSNDELRAELLKKESSTSNIEYARTVLELRRNLIAEGEPDPFLPYGSQVVPTDNDAIAAEKVATVLQECIDYADQFGGSNQVFTDELQRRMI